MHMSQAFISAQSGPNMKKSVLVEIFLKVSSLQACGVSGQSSADDALDILCCDSPRVMRS